jgi:hypothetical protein
MCSKFNKKSTGNRITNYAISELSQFNNVVLGTSYHWMRRNRLLQDLWRTRG